MVLVNIDQWPIVHVSSVELCLKKSAHPKWIVKLLKNLKVFHTHQLTQNLAQNSSNRLSYKKTFSRKLWLEGLKKTVVNQQLNDRVDLIFCRLLVKIRRDSDKVTSLLFKSLDGRCSKIAKKVSFLMSNGSDKVKMLKIRV